MEFKLNLAVTYAPILRIGIWFVCVFFCLQFSSNFLVVLSDTRYKRTFFPFLLKTHFFKNYAHYKPAFVCSS